MTKEENIIRLLKLTKDNKSHIIQDLRRAIIDFVNSNEKYISELELENMELHNNFKKSEKIFKKLISISVADLKLMRELTLIKKNGF